MKLLTREKCGNIRTVKLLGLKVFNYRKSSPMDKHRIIFEKLDKYRYILDIEPSENKQPAGNTDYIWQLWFQGEDNAPEIIKIALESVKKHCSGLNRVCLTENNLKDYIQLPDYIEDKYKRGIITKAHLSDYIRLCLLEKYGGTWIDATCYMTEQIPNEILESDFFQFKNSAYCEMSNLQFLYNRELLERFYPNKFFYHTGSSWFLHANPNNILISKTKQMLEEYWKNETKLIAYFLFHYVLAYCVLYHKESAEVFNNSLTLNNFNPHVLQKMFYEKYDEKDFNDIKNNSFIHKLSWKDLKIVNENNYLNHILNSDRKEINAQN
ncbi:capsular polysaccharide synthesis protein [bacterium]|nr:capsular polysaccharide synthesis protein [bacterium]